MDQVTMSPIFPVEVDSVQIVIQGAWNLVVSRTRGYSFRGQRNVPFDLTITMDRKLNEAHVHPEFSKLPLFIH